MPKRTFECKKMQLLAQRMYKITADARFVFWSVTSMQISFLRAATPDSTLLMLGERMIEKIIGATTEQLGGEELLMYIEILVKQEKFSEALPFECLSPLFPVFAHSLSLREGVWVSDGLDTFLLILRDCCVYGERVVGAQCLFDALSGLQLALEKGGV